MIENELSLLVGQCADFYAAYQQSIVANEEEVSSIAAFMVDFFTGANSYKLVTKDALASVAERIIQRESIENFVFSLRFVALAPFTKESLNRVIESFATANANSAFYAEKKALCVLPTDGVNWSVSKEDLVALYHANLWIIPLLAFAFLFKDMIERTPVV